MKNSDKIWVGALMGLSFVCGYSSGCLKAETSGFLVFYAWLIFTFIGVMGWTKPTD